MLELWQVEKRKRLVSALIKWNTNKSYDLYRYVIYADGREKVEVRFQGQEWKNLDLHCNQVNTLYRYFMQVLQTAGKIA